MCRIHLAHLIDSRLLFAEPVSVIQAQKDTVTQHLFRKHNQPALQA